MGWIAFRQGRLEDAAAYLKRAFDKFQDGEIAAHPSAKCCGRWAWDEARGIWQTTESAAGQRHPEKDDGASGAENDRFAVRRGQGPCPGGGIGRWPHCWRFQVVPAWPRCRRQHHRPQPATATMITPRAQFSMAGRFSAKGNANSMSGQFRYTETPAANTQPVLTARHRAG